MADLTLDPGIGLTELKLYPWAPGQSDVIAPYAPRLYRTGPTSTGWQGTVGFKAMNPSGKPELDREVMSLIARLRGNKHRVKLELPKAYRGDPPPPNASAAMTRARLVGDNVVVTIMPFHWGTWRPTPGSFINVGDRLYNLVSESGNELTLTPGIIPLGYERPRGIYLTRGGASPAAVNAGHGLGTFRGSLYESYGTAAGRDLVYWTDVSTGTRRIVLNVPFPVLNSLGNAYERVFGGDAIFRDQIRLYEVHIDLADPSRNRLINVLILNNVPGTAGAQVMGGLAEWREPDSNNAPKMYISLRTSSQIYRSLRPPPTVTTTGNFSDWFEPVSGPTGFTDIRGLSPGPNPGDPLYVLDVGANAIWTWDGTTQERWSPDGRFGANAGGGSISLATCSSIEWYRGRLYVQHINVGAVTDANPATGLARINYDVPADSTNVEFALPFVMARLSGSSVGPVGHQFPTPLFDWIEVPSA